MNARLQRVQKVLVPALKGNPWVVALAAVALVASLGFWGWTDVARPHRLKLGAGVELKYRKELIGVLCEESAHHDLTIEFETTGKSAESIGRVARGELDAAVVPAGLAIQDEQVRQVAVFDCEPLQLFVRPEIAAAGVPALKGKQLNLGAEGSGVRILAGEVLKFIGMKPGIDYQDLALAYKDLLALPPAKMPDGVFSLSPLPSPLGEQLVQQYGYQMLELPYGAAMALRKAAIEDAIVPAHTYSADPAVPNHPLHTVGTRAILIANAKVPMIPVRRLLEVLYESDFARRVNMPPLNEAWISRSSEYPNHAATVAYLHRHDPWVNKDFVDNFSNLKMLLVSVMPAGVLLWQWYRRRNLTGLNDYLRTCTKLESDALRAASRGVLDHAFLEHARQQLTALKIELLDHHQQGQYPGDQQFAMVLARVEFLQQTLPDLVAQAELEPEHELPARRVA